MLALKMSIGNQLIPTLLEVTNNLNALNTRHTEVINGTEYLVMQVGEETRAYIQVGSRMEEVTEKYNMLRLAAEKLAPAQQQAAHFANEHKNALTGLPEELDKTTGSADATAVALKKVTLALGELSKAELAQAAIDALNKEFEAGTISESQYTFEMTRLGTEVLGLPRSVIAANIELMHLKSNFQSGKTDAVGMTNSVFSLDRAINGLNDKNVRISVHTTYYETYAKGNDDRRQSGGPVAAGVPYMVGEAGPEMFVPNQSGTVIPNNRVAASVPAWDNLRAHVDRLQEDYWRHRCESKFDMDDLYADAETDAAEAHQSRMEDMAEGRGSEGLGR